MKYRSKSRELVAIIMIMLIAFIGYYKLFNNAFDRVQLKNVGDTSYDANFVVSVEFLHSQNLS